MSKTLIQATFLALLILTGCTNGSKPAAGDPFISMAVSQVSQENIIGYINDLVDFNTRHTMSTQTDPSQGIGAAVNYLKEKCEARTTTSTPYVQSLPEATRASLLFADKRFLHNSVLKNPE